MRDMALSQQSENVFKHFIGSDQQRPRTMGKQFVTARQVSSQEQTSQTRADTKIVPNSARTFQQDEQLKEVSQSEIEELKIKSKEDLIQHRTLRLKEKIEAMTFPDNPSLFG